MLLGNFARVVTGAAARAIIDKAKTSSDGFMGNSVADVDGADFASGFDASIPVSLAPSAGNRLCGCAAPKLDGAVNHRVPLTRECESSSPKTWSAVATLTVAPGTKSTIFRNGE